MASSSPRRAFSSAALLVLIATFFSLAPARRRFLSSLVVACRTLPFHRSSSERTFWFCQRLTLWKSISAALRRASIRSWVADPVICSSARCLKARRFSYFAELTRKARRIVSCATCRSRCRVASLSAFDSMAQKDRIISRVTSKGPVMRMTTKTAPNSSCSRSSSEEGSSSPAVPTMPRRRPRHFRRLLARPVFIVGGARGRHDEQRGGKEQGEGVRHDGLDAIVVLGRAGPPDEVDVNHPDAHQEGNVGPVVGDSDEESDEHAQYQSARRLAISNQ